MPYVLVFTSLAAVLGLSGLKVAQQMALAVKNTQANYSLSDTASQVIDQVLAVIAKHPSCYNWVDATAAPYQLTSECWNSNLFPYDYSKIYPNIKVAVVAEFCDANTVAGFELGSLMEFEFMLKVVVTEKNQYSPTIEQIQFWTRVGESIESLPSRTCI